MDNPHVVQDRFQRVVGKAENVAAKNDRTSALPVEQHLAVFGNLVLVFSGALEVIGIYVLQANENTLHAGAACFINEVRDAVTPGVHLNAALEIDLFNLAQVD